MIKRRDTFKAHSVQKQQKVGEDHSDCEENMGNTNIIIPLIRIIARITHQHIKVRHQEGQAFVGSFHNSVIFWLKGSVFKDVHSVYNLDRNIWHQL